MTTLSMSAATPRCFAVGSRAQSGGARKATTAGRTARVSRARGASLVARAAFTPAGAKIAGVGMAVPTTVPTAVQIVNRIQCQKYNPIIKSTD